MENVVQLAAALYNARDTMRRFWGDKYETKVAHHQQYIRSEMEKRNCNELLAAMKIIETLQEKQPDSGMAQALVMAACVEMIEPTASK